MNASDPGERIHELLPWYVAGTLTAHESTAFERHLPQCESCRTELEVVKQLRVETEQHGEAYFDKHPDAQEIVAAVRGELDAASTSRVRRHIAICAACAVEGRWIRGEATPAPAQVTRLEPRTKLLHRRWTHWVAVAAGIVIGLLLPFGTGDVPDPATGPFKPGLLVPAERAGESGTTLSLGPGEAAARLMIELDFAPGSFPLALEILTEQGFILHRDSIEQADLFDGYILFYECSRRLCSAGRYVLRLEAPNQTESATELRFEITER